MKILSLLLFAFTLCIISTSAQSKYNNTTMDEMKMTVYPQDTTAAAVILLKDATLDFTLDNLYGFRYEYTVSVKIKILKPEGLDEANQQIYFIREKRGSEEVINSLSGTTYNLENGKIEKTKLSKEHIFDSSQDNKHFIKKFTMPAAKVGSIIEYKYTMVSDYYYQMRSFSFQESVPVEYVSYRVTIPEWFDYNTNMQGYQSVSTKIGPVNKTFLIQGNRISCLAEEKLFTAKNVPALKPEPYVWDIDDYRSQVTFELRQTKFPYEVVRNYTSTWPNIDKKLLESSSYGENTQKKGLFKDEIAVKEQNIGNAREILNIIKSKVKWNEENHFYPEDNLKNPIKNGIGSSADINFLYINALKAGGFEAYPVMISTRDNGRMPIANPSITAFNYTLTAVKIDTAMYYVDASAKYGNINILPEKCMVDKARILDPKGSYWVDLTKISSGTTSVLANLAFKEDGLKGTMQVAHNGNAGYDFREDYFGKHKSKEEYVEKLGANIGCQIKDFTIEGDQNTAEKVKVTFDIHKDATLEDEFLYINPLMYKIYGDNPFKSEHRLYPVQFDYLDSFTEVINITIPEGYAVEELPKSERFIFGGNRAIVFSYLLNNVGDKISINYQMQMKTILVLQDEYEHLKEFFAKVVAKSNEQIVLKKI